MLIQNAPQATEKKDTAYDKANAKVLQDCGVLTSEYRAIESEFCNQILHHWRN
jgi:hypothetical protein